MVNAAAVEGGARHIARMPYGTLRMTTSDPTVLLTLLTGLKTMNKARMEEVRALTKRRRQRSMFQSQCG